MCGSSSVFWRRVRGSLHRGELPPMRRRPRGEAQDTWSRRPWARVHVVTCAQYAERCLLEAGIGVVVDIILPRVVRLCLTLNEPYM